MTQDVGPSPLGRRDFLAATIGTFLAGCAQEDGPTADMAGPKLVEIAPGIHTVRGPLSPFDPRHPAVNLRLPQGVTKPPLLILVHGGAGARDQANAMALFHAHGVAVLGFDAYRVAGLERNSIFWIRNATYEARQRMIYSAPWAPIAGRPPLRASTPPASSSMVFRTAPMWPQTSRQLSAPPMSGWFSRRAWLAQG